MRTLSLLIVLSAIFQVSAQTWLWDQTPVAGENVMVHIQDVPTDEPVYLVSYCFEGTKLVSSDVGMLPSNHPNQIHAVLTVPDHASWVRVVLRSESGSIITADEQSVRNTKCLPKSGQVERALSMGAYARTLGMTRNDTVAVALLREAIEAYPAWMEEPDVFRAYYAHAKGAGSTPDVDRILTWIRQIPPQTAKTQEALMVHAVRAALFLGDTVLHTELKEQVNTAFPRNSLLQETVMAKFRSSGTIEEKLALRQEVKDRFGITTDNTPMLDQMTSTIVQHYAKLEDWDAAKKYIMEIHDPLVRARVCNQYAWTLSGESIEAPAPHLAVAAELSAQSLQLLAANTSTPPGTTRKELDRNMDYAKGMYGDTYALILFKKGQYNEAIDHQAFAVQQSKYADFEMNERYAIFLEKAGRTAEFETFMDRIMVSGKASEKVRDMHRTYWTSQRKQDELYASYVQHIEERANAQLMEKVGKKWQDKKAAGFTLKDLAGKEVSLEDYKGKTVVLDFWATWCGPCKASFPGMQQAVNDYAGDEDVAFLFIDTWEGGENVEAKVSKFITDHAYTFHVLMDRENKVVAEYKVEGIPTKFIIGPDQKIRFTSVGYSGNNEELVKELKAMIEMARGKSKA